MTLKDLGEEGLTPSFSRTTSSVLTQITVSVSVSASVSMSKSATSELSTGLSYLILFENEGVKLS
jgi:hypothetical protein